MAAIDGIQSRDDATMLVHKTILGFHVTSSKLKNKELSILLRF